MKQTIFVGWALSSCGSICRSRKSTSGGVHHNYSEDGKIICHAEPRFVANESVKSACSELAEERNLRIKQSEFASAGRPARKQPCLFQNCQKPFNFFRFLQKTSRFLQKMAQNIQKVLQKPSILAHLHFCAVVFSPKTPIANFRSP